MDILKQQFPIKSLIFLKSNGHAKMAPDSHSPTPWRTGQIDKAMNSRDGTTT